jgi:hypothetical protein
VTVVGAGCATPEQVSWQDQVTPSGACWDVDLSDGLDDSSTDELHALFDCLNQSGGFEPLRDTVDAFDQLGRDGDTLGFDLAHLLARAPAAGVDLGGLLELAVDLVEPDAKTGVRPIEMLLHASVEMVYGAPYATVAATGPSWGASALDEGAVRPLLPVLGSVATAVLDDGQDIPALLATALADPALSDLSCSVKGLWATSDPTLSALNDRLLGDLGAALGASQNADNDRWSSASGDSLRDLSDVLLLTTAGDGLTPLEAMSPAILELVADADLIEALSTTLEQADNDGLLEPLPAELLHLVEVDANGDRLVDAGTDSALVALLRLMSAGNTEVSCSLDYWVASLDVDLGNLSVAILQLLAEQDPETVETGVSILGQVLGWAFTQGTLELIADSGVCPVIDDQLLADLAAVDRLNDSEVTHLTPLLLAGLADVHTAGEVDHIPALVDLLHLAWARGAAEPLEEVVRDLATSSLVNDAVVLLQVAIEPADLDTSVCADGSHPVDLVDLAGLVRAGLDEAGGETPLTTLHPALVAMAGADGTWTALHNMGELLRLDEAELHSISGQLLALSETTSSGDADGSLAAALRDPDLVEPALRLIESAALRDALGASELTREGPLPFYARLVSDGTLSSVLRTIDLVLDFVNSATTADRRNARQGAQP